MRRVKGGLRYCLLVLAVAMSSCGSGGLVGFVRGSGGPTPFPVEAPYDTAVIQSYNNACQTTYSIHRDGGAQRTTQSCGSSQTLSLPAALVSNLFSDLQAAQPLNSLTPCRSVDIALTVQWNGQQSPNLFGSCGGTSAAQDALSQQISSVMTAFTPVP